MPTMRRQASCWRRLALGAAVLAFLLPAVRPCCGQAQAAAGGRSVYLFAVSVQGEDSTNEIYRYRITPRGAPVLDRTISGPTLNRPYGLAFSPWGEMFVVNRGYPWPGEGNGNVARFVNPGGIPAANGTIDSSHFECPHGAAFRGNELFIGQRFGDNVLRFVFNIGGQAAYNGEVVDGLCCTAPRGVALSPDRDRLFVAECCSVHQVDVFAFASDGSAVLVDTINDERLVNPHSIAFSPWGEMFVTNSDAQNVLRYLPDETEGWQPNGELTGNGLDGPSGLAFSPWGELFVSSIYGNGGISRWEFDAEHNAIPHGVIDTPATLGEIRFYSAGRVYQAFLPLILHSAQP